MLSILVALALGAPMYSQMCYLVGLPISVAAPVVLSSIVWLLVVEIARTTAVRGGFVDKAFVGIAIAVASLVTIPKLALIGYATLKP
jgi:hypothetical protein